MPRVLHVEGRRNLEGNVYLSGYKHSAVVLINAALLLTGVTKLSNLPKIQDVFCLLRLFEELGCRITIQSNVVEIEASHLCADALGNHVASEIHGSAYLIPTMLAREGQVKVFAPGGCRIGERGIEHILALLEQMGAQRVRRDGELWLEAPRRLNGAVLDGRRVSPQEHSGYTKTALLAGALADGETEVLYPFLGQEIDDLCNFLQRAGAHLTRDDRAIRLTGQAQLHGAEYEVPPDFLEFVTLACAVQLAGGQIRVSPSPPWRYFEQEAGLLHRSGLAILETGSGLQITAGRISPLEFTCPPVYSDLQPILAAMLVKAEGTSVIIDNVWTKRFDHVSGLRKLGGKIEQDRNQITIVGPAVLNGADLEASDLRSAAAQLIAALAAKGRSTLRGAEHLQRGYSDLPGQLRALGAAIREV